MAPQPAVPTCPPSRAGRLRAFFVLMGLVVLCLLAFRSPAFAEEATPEGADDGIAPRAAMDVTDKVSIDGIKLQKKSGSTWQDIPAGTTLTSGAYVRIYIDWSIPDMTDVNANDMFTFTIDGEDHFLASDFGPVDLIDPGTSKVIGSYVVNGNRDANGSMIPGKAITIVTTLSAEGAEFPSLHSGFFSLEGYVTGTGDDIVFEVNGELLPSINVDPPSTGPLPGTPLLKYGSQVAGQNQIVWDIGVNLDNIVNAYAGYAAGGSDPSPQQRNLLLTDELQGGQAITSSGVVVYMPIVATTDAGEAQTEQYAAYPITDLFTLVDKSAADGMTQDEFANSVRFAADPTIGVWENRVVYIGFGNVPTGDGSSALNIGKILNGQGELGLSQLLDQKGVTPAQKAIIMKYFSASGPNKGDFTSFIIELRTDASETGQYDNTATLTYGDSSSEQSSGAAHFTVISGGVEVRDGKAVLTKVDAGDAGITLPGAVFKLEKMQPDNSWATVAGSERLTTDPDGLITVTGLLLGQYRFVELEPPAGYVMESEPVEFAITSATPNHTVAVSAKNSKSPVLGKVALTKVDADSPTTVLPGATFKLEERAGDGSWVDVPGHDALVTDGNGLITVDSLTMGTYRFVEVSAPEGYELETEPVEFTLAEDTPGLEVAVTATNAKSPVLGGAVLKKVDGDAPGTVLPGATFKLEQRLADDTWAVVDGHEALVTDGDGLVTVTDLPVGSYRFVETAAPEGYVLDETPREFAIDAAAPAPVVVNITAENAKEPPVGKVVLTKVDADDGSVKLPGAVFKLEARTADGWEPVAGSESLTTDGNGLIEVADLPMGTYRFVELSAPEGYELETEPVEFTLAEDTPGPEVAVTATNVKSPVLGGAVLKKVDADEPGTVLPGATFKLEQRLADDSWETVPGHDALVTDGDGLVAVTDLPVGAYRFVETAAPEGYVLDETPREFAIDAAAPAPVVVNITAENAKEPPVGKAILTKVDADSPTTVLSGAVFKLEARTADGWEPVAGSERLTTDGNGLIEVADLPMGTYRFVELSAPEGYELETEPVEFELTADTPELTAAVTATNTKTPVFGKAVLTKVDEENPDATLPGATFKLEQRLADDSWETVPGYDALVTDGDGLITVADLPVGSYRFVETAAPEGYVLDETPREFAIDATAPNPVVTLTATNAKEPPAPLGKAVLTKVDADDGSVKLPGAVFKLESQQPGGSWEVVQGSERLTTDANGLIEVTDLPMGFYRFIELTPPEGYELETAPVEFTLAEDTPDYTVAVTATNKKTPVLGGALLTKVDADEPTTVLPGATFKLEQRLADDTWAVVDGHDGLVTDEQGIIEVANLPVGVYRFVETAAPEGYVLDETPVEFTVAVGQPSKAELTMKNAPVPPDPVDPVDPTDPTDPADPTNPATPGTPSTTQPSTSNPPSKISPMASIARTGDAVPFAVLGVLGALAVGALATALLVARRRARRR